jgi:hypothetical protein
LYGNNLSSEKAKELMACCTFSNSGPLPLVRILFCRFTLFCQCMIACGFYFIGVCSRHI